MRGIDAAPPAHDDIDPEVGEFSRQLRRPLFPSIREAELYLDRLAGDVAELPEPRFKRLDLRLVPIDGRHRVQKADARDALPGARGERPRCG